MEQVKQLQDRAKQRRMREEEEASGNKRKKWFGIF